MIAEHSTKNLPKWLEFSNPEHFEAKVSAVPRREDIDLSAVPISIADGKRFINDNSELINSYYEKRILN